MDFMKHYFREKTIQLPGYKSDHIKNPDDIKCIQFGKELADRFGLLLNGWGEYVYYFTIPEGVPNEKNTFVAKNEEGVVNNLKKKFPEYLEYIMNKNFPYGYVPDERLSEPPKECEYVDPMDLAKKWAEEKGENVDGNT